MGDHFLLRRVVLSFSVSIGIGDSPGVVPGFVVIAFHMEGEMPINTSHFVILVFKVGPMLHVPEVAE